MKLKQNEKKVIIERLLITPKKNKRLFWAREIKLLNDLYSLFPLVEFWEKINFSKKYESLTFLRSEYGMKELKKKFMEYNYAPRKKEEIKLYSKKFGETYTKKQQSKTIKSFLTNE